MGASYLELVDSWVFDLSCASAVFDEFSRRLEINWTPCNATEKDFHGKFLELPLFANFYKENGLLRAKLIRGPQGCPGAGFLDKCWPGDGNPLLETLEWLLPQTQGSMSVRVKSQGSVFIHYRLTCVNGSMQKCYLN